ncbi:hypothetical protein C1J01_11310 [Nonomuraea aridisoli]|uniref:Uncharacterized protein n=1 Tax=Nonomuraea aridisoli TaxID=2070368 RepID=A0A2W2ESN2_9ACTN|nr:hypothetical protein C1J01_11310 [Nonomuraea aridisoli]
MADGLPVVAVTQCRASGSDAGSPRRRPYSSRTSAAKASPSGTRERAASAGSPVGCSVSRPSSTRLACQEEA